ncbi:MAG: glycosyltransferase 87 family protein [Pseudomonadota bacterium]
MAGATAPLLVWLAPRVPDTRRTLIVIFLTGAAMRALMVASLPVLEDDSYRYLWDGAVAAHGVDPYANAPVDASPIDSFGNPRAAVEDADLETLRGLAEAAPEVHRRINFPYVKTIYPPVAQAGFAIAHWLSPFDLTSWKLVLFAVDIGAFALLTRLLAQMGKSRVWTTLYWWNPIVLVQVFGAAHMDGLLAPFILGAALLANRDRPAWTGLALAGAAAVKFWPLLLAPALARRWLFQWRSLIVFGAVLGAATLLLLWPQLRHLTDPATGVAVYSESWRRNAFLFAVLEDGAFAWAADPGRVARVFVAAAVSGFALWMAWKSPPDGSAAPTAMLAAAAALFFLSPTGYPWYFVWLAVLLPMAPSYGIAALSATLPLYSLRFLLGDETAVFQWGVVPFAFGLPLAILALEALRARRRPV